MGQDFSNAILEGYLKFAAEYQDGRIYPALLQALGKDESWLKDTSAWHDAAFAHHFFSTLKALCPDQRDLVFQGARYLYTQKKLQRFTALAGLLLKPELVFSKLPRAGSRMNLYNSWEFTLLRKRLAYSTARIVQRYRHPELVGLNQDLCDAARGSTHGILEYLGYRLLELRETSCVKNGHAHCAYEITWGNRPLLGRILIWLLFATTSYTLLRAIPGTSSLEGGLVATLVATLAILTWTSYWHRRSLQEAFEFQESSLNDLRKIAARNQSLNNLLLNYQKEMRQTLALASVGELSYSFIHDMASPITLIQAYSSELSRTIQDRNPADKDYLIYCTSICKATQRLAKLQSLFRMATQSQLSTQLVRMDLARTVNECVDPFRPILERNGIELRLELPTGLPMLEVYEGCLESVILNLFQNALKALGNREDGRIRIQARKEPGYLVLRIEDSGPGIPAERLTQLWERFGPSAFGPEKGTGFGLYSVHKAVERMNGGIQAFSGESGTAFEIRLPA